MGGKMASSWKRCEHRAGDFHNPGEGTRVPLSGGGRHSGGTDCEKVPGLFIECKQRKSFSVFGWYLEAATKATQSNTVPVLSLFRKGAKGPELSGSRGFLDVVHSKFIDRYIQVLARNRAIGISGFDHAMSKTNGVKTKLTLIFTGQISVCATVRSLVSIKSFDSNFAARPEWWKFESDSDEYIELFPWLIAPGKSGTANLFGTFGPVFDKAIAKFRQGQQAKHVRKLDFGPLITEDDYMRYAAQAGSKGRF